MPAPSPADANADAAPRHVPTGPAAGAVTDPSPAGAAAGNDRTAREGAWRRWPGDDWAAFDALPPAVRRRMQGHAYDPWSVNAAMLWRMLRLWLASSARAERRLLRHLDRCEALERQNFDRHRRRRHGAPLPHVAAGATVLR